jgi:hypothetical protein
MLALAVSSTSAIDASGPDNYLIYDPSSLKLINVSSNDVIGLGSGSAIGVPATDINGVSRLRGDNNEYADPGAFTTDLLTFNRKIGPYREYTTFGDAEDDVVAISTDGNLAQRNEAIVFEADAGDYAEAPVFENTLITDAQRTVTYKAGEKSKHEGDLTKGVRFTSTNGLSIRQRNMVLDGFVVSVTNGNPLLVQTTCHVKNVLVSTPRPTQVSVDTSYETAVSSAPVFENMAIYGGTRSFAIDNSDASTTFTPKFVNCTMVGAQQGVRFSGITIPIERIDIINCWAPDTTNGTIYNHSIGDTTTVSGTGNIGRGGGLHANADFYAEGKSWYWTTDTTASSTGSQAVYEAATGKMLAVSGNDAIGVATVSSAPTTDINGTSRLRGVGTQYADPGAFTTDVNTITKTIGIGGAASGFDFADITEAEAALIANSVTYSKDYAKKNIAVVFDISPGLYTDNFNVYLSAHSFGPGNSVTFQKAQDEIPVFKPTGNLYFAVPFGTLDSFKTNTFATCLRPFMSTAGAGQGLGTPEYPITLANCYFDGLKGVASYTAAAFSGSYYVDVINCAFDHTFGGAGLGQHFGVDLVANANGTGRGRIFNSIDYAPDAYTGTAFNIYSQLSGEYTGNYSVNAFNPNNSASVINSLVYRKSGDLCFFNRSTCKRVWK